MADKRIFVPYGSKKAAELIEKFRRDPLFKINVTDESTYNSVFLEYRKNLLDLAKEIVDKQKTEYQKSDANLPFLVQNLHAFYVRNKDLSVYDLRKNSSILAWFFANQNKIKEHFNIDVKLSNVDSIQQILQWKQKIEEAEIPFLDLWENFVNHIIQDKEQTYLLLYPEQLSFDAINKEKMVAVLIKKDNIDDAFSQFQKLMLLTNKDKSCKLCIFNSYNSFYDYLIKYNLIVLAIHPSLGYYKTPEKRGLIVHIITISEDGLIKEVADYMNDHEVSFPGSVEMIAKLDSRIFQVIHNRDDVIDIQKVLNLRVDVEDLYKKFLINTVRARHLELLASCYNRREHIFNPKYSKEDSISDLIIRYMTPKVFNDIADNRPEALTKEFIEYIKDSNNIKNLLGEIEFEKLQANHRKFIDKLVFDQVYKILTATDIAIDIKDKKETKNKLEISFDTLIHNKFTNDKIPLQTKLVLDKKESSDSSSTYDDDEEIAIINFSDLVKNFIDQNKHVILSNEVATFLNSIVEKVVNNPNIDFQKLNVLEKTQFQHITYRLYSFFILNEINKNRSKLIDEIVNNNPDIVKEFATLCIDRFVKNTSNRLYLSQSDVYDMVNEITNLFDSKEKIKKFQDELESLQIKKIFSTLMYDSGKLLSLFYYSKSNVHTDAKDLVVQLLALSAFLDFYVDLERDYKSVLDQAKRGPLPDEDKYIYIVVEKGMHTLSINRDTEKYLDEMFQNIIKTFYSSVPQNILEIKTKIKNVFVDFIANSTIKKLLEDLY